MKYVEAAIIMMALFIASVSAEELPAGDVGRFGTGAEIDFNSKYLWHGQSFSAGAVVQPSVWVSFNDFTATIWNNYEISKNFNETDVSFGYSHNAGKFLLEPTLSYYTYFHQPDSDPIIEFSTKISYPLSDAFSLYTLQNFYFLNGDAGDSYFGGLGANFEGDITNNIKFNISPFAGWGSIKYNRENFDCPKWALNVISADIAFECVLPGGWYVKPHFLFTTISDKTLIDDNRNNSAAGIAIGREF